MKRLIANNSRLAWKFARPFVLAYLLIVLGMMLLESRLVYPIPAPKPPNWRPPPPYFAYNDVTFHSTDGTQLHGWLLSHPNSRAILYCHGNGEDVESLGEFAAQLRDALQATVFVFDYRGYGRSEGRPSEEGCIADGRAARKWLAGITKLEPTDIILMGRSLGTGLAVALAAEEATPALVLECAFPSMPEVAARQYPWLPVRWVMDNCYDNIARIRHYRGPLFQSHGASDEIIPSDCGRQLFDAAPSAKKQWIEFPGFGHNNAWPASYYEELAQFLDTEAASLSSAPALQTPLREE